MKKVKVGIIGLGFMGTTHYSIHKSLPQVEIVAVADVDPVKRSGDISKVVGNISNGDNTQKLDFSKIVVYDDAMKLILDPNVEMVDICAPTFRHREMILAALASGKHVFSEKPLCRDRAEMASIREAAEKAKTFFNVGMCIRAWPEYRHTLELFRDGKLGAIKMASFRRLSPDIAGDAWENWFMNNKRSGAALLDLHLHDADFICALLGRPKAVSAFGVKGVTSDCGVDQVFCRYDYGENMLVTAEGGWASARKVPFEMCFRLICEKATVTLDGNGYKIYWKDGTVETPDLNVGALPTGWHQELNYFTNCILEGKTPDKYQTLDSVMDAYSVICAEADSVDKNQTVEVKYV